MLRECFLSEKEYIDKDKFLQIVQEIHSEIFLFVNIFVNINQIIIFLLEKRPFTKTTLKEFNKSPKIKGNALSDKDKSDKVFFERRTEKSHTDKGANPNLLGGDLITNFSPGNSPGKTLIKSPKQQSKFAPNDKITNSPSFRRNQSAVDDMNIRDNKGQYTLSINAPNKLKKDDQQKTPEKKNNKILRGDSKDKPSEKKNTDSFPIRRNRNLLKNIDDVDKKSAFKTKKQYPDDMEIKKVVKTTDSGGSLKDLSNEVNKEVDKAKELIDKE